MDVFFIFIAEIAHGGKNRIWGSLTEAAEGAFFDFIAEVDEEIEIGFFAVAFSDAGQSFKHAFGTDTAESAFAAAFTVCEVEEVAGGFNHTAFIADDDHTA